MQKILPFFVFNGIQLKEVIHRSVSHTPTLDLAVVPEKCLTCVSF